MAWQLPEDKGWTRLGPGGGGTMYHPTVSPHDPDTVILTCDMTGQYITRDGGRHWRMCHLMVMCDCFAFDPLDPKRIYAGANALYATDDFGVSWHMIWPAREAGRETRLVGDEASPEYVGKGWPGGRVTALAISPTDSGLLLAGLTGARKRGDPGRAAIYLSEDRGASWRPVAELGGGRVLHLAISHAGEAWAITSQGLFRAEDGGRQWSAVPFPPGGELVGGAVGFSRGHGPLLYVIKRPEDGSPAGLFVSSDGGQEWRHVGAGVPGVVTREGHVWGPPVRVVAVCRDRPEVAYLGVSVAVPGEGGRRDIGVVKTCDAGETWRWVLRANAREEPDNFEPDWLTRAYGSPWPDYPVGLGVAPTNPDVCYATDMGRTILTTDGGRSWRSAINDWADDGGAYTRGLDVTTCYGVHFDPHDGERVFISYTDIGLHMSRNRGRSWHHRIRGVPRAWRNTCYWLVFDPEVPGKMWSVWSGGHDYPRLKMFRGQGPRHFRGGVCVSEDGGETWSASNMGMEEVGCTHIVLDPTSPPGRRTLYVAAFGRGVYKSVDDGDSWQLCNRGLPEENLAAWRLAGDPAGTMYLVIARAWAEGRVIPGGIYYTEDGAQTWQRMEISDQVPFPNDLCVHPADRNLMYLAAWPVGLEGRMVEGGVFRTRDAGASWERLEFPGQYVYAVSVDPREPGVVYATCWHHGVFRSEDEGETWERLGGANFGWPHRVIPDPFDPERIYLTTFGASVWHGPKRGRPEFGPDIVDLPPVAEVIP